MNFNNIRKCNFILLSVVLLAVALLFSGCASLGSSGEDEVLYIIQLINSGDYDLLTAASADSFLLDAEILQGRTLTGSLWKGLADAGFRISNPVVTEKRPPEAVDKVLFGDSNEVDIFFSKYIPPRSMLFKVETGSSYYIFILGRPEKGSSSIIAFGGPYR